jgi:hypothetical protein
LEKSGNSPIPFVFFSRFLSYRKTGFRSLIEGIGPQRVVKARQGREERKGKGGADGRDRTANLLITKNTVDVRKIMILVV